MKNVLFATTALIATAGIASAEVSLSGSAEMGIIGGDQGITNVAGNNNDENFADQFHTDIDVTFTLSGESDNGITFGATIDLDESQDSNGNFAATDGGPEAVFISGDFGTLTMGDTDGALDKAVAETDLIGDIADASTTYSVKSAAFMDGLLDGQVARYDYSIAGFGLSLSAETDDEGVDRTTWGFGATYSVAGYDFGAGYQGGEDQEGWMVSASTTFGAVDVVANYGEGITNVDGAVDAVAARYNIAMVYTMDALSLGANYGEIHTDGASTDKGFGLAANYDLGGGLVLQAGYGEQTVDLVGVSGDDPINMYSLGLSMSF
ncbi:porin [Donghicola eburneus]|uniref:Putative secreted protein n=1 Tax=Donghicola eburneus TaxID=393278 RepID=A0A1M4N3T5_9RHOB|nr:porin [Donghicola eburneus]SCM69550.1 putative secreted protein [Donghicola eburneus]SFQ48160.1 outer membrane protein OmpU [Donghicola eburneus]